MTQRYRAILHLIDPIIEAGHELTIVVSDARVDVHDFRDTPCDVSKSSKNTLLYLAKNFGIQVKHIDKVWFTRRKRPRCDLMLCYDQQDKHSLGIPYNTYCCFWKGKELLVGNPMCEAIKNCDRQEEEGKCLIIHPGGGRGYVSPQRKELSKKKVVQENIRFLQTTLDALPQRVRRVAIKTHPFPYRRCSAAALNKYVVPSLRFCGDIEAVEDNLIGEIASSELILNWGGTSALWLVGSGKFWFNIKGMAWHKAKREKLIDERGGGIELKELKNAARIGTSYTFGLPAVANIMEKINELAGV